VSSVTGQRWADDDELVVALKQALRPASPVPPSFIEAGKAAYAWHNIDAELAGLTYDSALEGDLVGAGSRAESAPLRALTFASAELTIEVEVTHDALFGQLVPPQPGTVQVCLTTGDGRERDTPVDEVGCFVIRPVPAGSFRLRCHTAAGLSVLTGWMTT